mgnify:CR=1 FL=1
MLSNDMFHLKNEQNLLPPERKNCDFEMPSPNEF